MIQEMMHSSCSNRYVRLRILAIVTIILSRIAEMMTCARKWQHS